MPDSGDLGYGILFKIGNGASPEVFTTVAKVTNITPPGASRDAVEVTHNESPDRYKEFIPGLVDGGEAQLDLNYKVNSSTTALLNAEFGSTEVKNYLIVWPSGASLAFSGFCTAFEPEAPIDDKQAASATWKVSGKPVLTQV